MPTPPEKRLLYPLCGFLIQKKLSEEGKGLRRPLHIRLQDFGSLFGGRRPTVGQINQLKAELVGLAGDMDGKLLEIVNRRQVFTNFTRSYRENIALILKYKRSDLENYVAELREGDRLRFEGASSNRLTFSSQDHQFRFRGRSMWVRQSERGIPVRLNICLLMFRHSVADPEHQGEEQNLESQVAGYRVGHPVNYDALYQLIFTRRGEEGPRDDKFRPIRDAIIGLNRRAHSSLHRYIFEQENQSVRVIV
ncbi:MAG: hypothetical protein A2655_03590 [Candidatus Yanofskybacteria bacterium RIFCSPHIGHO2_01_FULL_43_42]|uniref:Uncharacterized protein n=1 Tax=Candidatus Collierbacteria bacterium RIFCSPHIGHO2_02_FULL_49_10 TaxID=1817723 RepID=A0A1F5EW76_9BACT|nr:MAG: hypothetical protein A3D09_02190 [Candidatus Collierbacteria bacterium RIFCSPHIGHO2_02_FULL_49_10]OGN03252.1 MAG: hypothetical protein A2655_03590 [Candidatus Yanofskybacteria bacterium RIFCSPHIGHO2_01_FULL_43_42]